MANAGTLAYILQDEAGAYGFRLRIFNLKVMECSCVNLLPLSRIWS